MLKQASALERILDSTQSALPSGVAEYLLQLNFSPEDQARYEALSYKAQGSSLTVAEKEELDDLLTTNDVLMFLQSKARASLKKHTPAA